MSRRRTPGQPADLTRRAALTILLCVAMAGCQRSAPEQTLIQAQAAWDAGGFDTALRSAQSASRAAPKAVAPVLLLARFHAERQDAFAAEAAWRHALELGGSPEEALPGWLRARVAQGDARGALDAAKAARLQTGPGRVALQTVIGEAYEALGDLQAAQIAWQEALALEPASASIQLSLIRLQARQGKRSAAQTALTLLLAQQNAPAEAWAQQAEWCLERNDTQGAMRALEQAVQRAPAHPVHRTKLIALLLDQGQTDTARRALATLVVLAPDRLSTHYLQARLSFQTGAVDDARTRVTRILSSQPDYAAARVLSASIALRQGLIEEAKQQARWLIDRGLAVATATRVLMQAESDSQRIAQALLLAKQARARGVRDLDLAVYAGDLALRHGELKEAADWFAWAAELDPRHSAGRLAPALTALERGDHAAAVRDLTEVAAADHDSTRADISLISTLLRLKRFEAAQTAASRLIDKQAHDPLGYNLRGMAAVGLGQPEEARRAFEEALRQDPAFFAAAANLARLDQRAGQYESARARLTAVVERNPRSVAAMSALAQLANEAGRRAEATPWLRRAHQVDPDALDPLLALCMQLIQLGRVSEAHPLLAYAAQRHPEDLRLLDLQASALLASGHTEQALETLERITRLVPRATQPRVRLAGVRVAVGDIEGAVEALQTASRLDPSAAIDALTSWGSWLLRDHRSALALVSRGLQASPERALGWTIEGDLAAGEARWAQAAGAYRKALEAVPGAESLRQRLREAQRQGPGSEAGLAEAPRPGASLAERTALVVPSEKVPRSSD